MSVSSYWNMRVGSNRALPPEKIASKKPSFIGFKNWIRSIRNLYSKSKIMRYNKWHKHIGLVFFSSYGKFYLDSFRTSLAHTIDTFIFSLGLEQNGFLFHEKCEEEKSSYIGSYNIFDTPVFFNFWNNGWFKSKQILKKKQQICY